MEPATLTPRNPLERNRVLTAVGALLAGLALAACATAAPTRPDHATSSTDVSNGTGFTGTLLDPPLPRPHVGLTDTAGRRFDFTDRPADEVTVLFFGFTHCDDVCPTTMADLAVARRAIPPSDQNKIVVAFATVDPRRDTPAVLRRWLDRYDTDFVGLRGAGEVIRLAERSLYAPVSHIERPIGRHAGAAGKNRDYDVEHSGTVYVFGSYGESLVYTGGTTPTQYADDFTRLLSAS